MPSFWTQTQIKQNSGLAGFETWEPKQVIMIPVKFVKGPSFYSGSQADHWKNRERRDLADKKEMKNCASYDLLFDYNSRSSTSELWNINKYQIILCLMA